MTMIMAITSTAIRTVTGTTMIMTTDMGTITTTAIAMGTGVNQIRWSSC